MIQKKHFAVLLLGVVVGILIAPSKGSQTRRKISRAVGDLSDYIEDNIINDEANVWDEGIEEQIEKMEDSIA